MSTTTIDPLWQSVITFCNISTISLCMICKLPQIRAILASGSIRSISVQSVMVELLGYTIVLGYNVVQGYPLASFMEYVFLVVQDIILLLVIFRCIGTLDIVKLGLVGLYIALFYGFTQGVPHPKTLPFLMRFATPCSASSKVLQLKAIWETKNSQTVSVTTWLIAAYTCVSRIITNMLLTGDVPLLVNYFVGLVLNASIIGSALYFRMPNKTTETEEKVSSKTKTDNQSSQDKNPKQSTKPSSDDSDTTDTE
ncbi:PQ-loop repeat-containing protein 3 [Orchesella cincta]|uniref:PQ-loop repeat-containing protein 3 n=1 Tax=Orchesella cincta TaxID=48709 RepID=A0A1D2MDK6_ORCCI|nr:PQ-loop repeat-containing protein 3 [Orchesella cincta]